MKIISKILDWLFGPSHLGGLTEEEYEEYEFLGSAMDWRRLTFEETMRYENLKFKRGLND